REAAERRGTNLPYGREALRGSGIANEVSQRSGRGWGGRGGRDSDQRQGERNQLHGRERDGQANFGEGSEDKQEGDTRAWRTQPDDRPGRRGCRGRGQLSGREHLRILWSGLHRDEKDNPLGRG